MFCKEFRPGDTITWNFGPYLERTAKTVIKHKCIEVLLLFSFGAKMQLVTCNSREGRSASQRFIHARDQLNFIFE